MAKKEKVAPAEALPSWRKKLKHPLIKTYLSSVLIVALTFSFITDFWMDHFNSDSAGVAVLLAIIYYGSPVVAIPLGLMSFINLIKYGFRFLQKKPYFSLLHLILIWPVLLSILFFLFYAFGVLIFLPANLVIG